MSQTKAQLISDLVQALAFTATASAPTNGMFLSASNTLAISTNSSTRLTVDSSGNVGIGTTSPTRELQVSAAVPQVALLSSDSTICEYLFGDVADDNVGRIRYEHATNNLSFWTDTAERMRIDSSGRVGIGTTSPSSFNSAADDLVISSSSDTGITINAGTSSSANVFFADSDGNSRGQIRYFHSSDSLSFAAGGSDSMRINSSGQVGIGTTSPGTILNIRSDSSDDGILLEKTDGTDIARLFHDGTTTDARLDLFSGGSANIQLKANGVSHFSGGNVGIGTTSPGANLDISASANPTIRLTDTAGSRGEFIYNESGSVSTLTIAADPADASTPNTDMRFTVDGSEAMRIDSEGRLLVGPSSSRVVGSARKVQVEGTSDASAGVSLIRNSNDSNSPTINIGKSRGTSVGSNTVVQADDGLGSIYFRGADGTDLTTIGAAIEVAVDGTPGSNDLPGRLVFSTTADGASSTTERMRIDSSGNVGIGTTSPGRTLDVEGVIRSDGTSGALAFGGNSSTPSEGAAIHRPANNTLAFVTDSTERMRIDSSGIVKVGTGSTVTPDANADDFVIDKGAADTGLSILSTTTGRIYFGDAGDDEAGSIRYVHTDNSLRFETASSERLRIDSSGRLLIGTTSARSLNGDTQLLQVEAADGSGTGRITIGTNNNDNTTGAGIYLFRSRGGTLGSNTIVQNGDDLGSIYFHGADGTDADSRAAQIRCEVDGTPGTNDMPGRLVFNTTADGASSPTERMRIDSSGRLLVGTTSTSTAIRAAFQASSGGTGGGVILISRGTNSPTNQQSLGEIYFADSGHAQSAVISARRDAGTWTSGSSQPTFLRFSTTEDGDGSPEEKVRIFGDGTQHFFSKNNGLIVGTNRNASTTYYFFRGIRSRTSNTSGGTSVYYVYSNGNVENTNNSYGSISDAKLKENIVDATSQWDDLKALQIRKYNFIEGETHTQLGVIAQEVETVSPGLVYERPDSDEEGNDLGTVTKGVNYSVLYMKAVKALQEAMERIETLEAKVAALEAG